nr:MULTISPECIES: hypothetical protein [Corallococcus]
MRPGCASSTLRECTGGMTSPPEMSLRTPRSASGFRSTTCVKRPAVSIIDVTP